MAVLTGSQAKGALEILVGIASVIAIIFSVVSCNQSGDANDIAVDANRKADIANSIAAQARLDDLISGSAGDSSQISMMTIVRDGIPFKSKPIPHYSEIVVTNLSVHPMQQVTIYTCDEMDLKKGGLSHVPDIPPCSVQSYTTSDLTTATILEWVDIAGTNWSLSPEVSGAAEIGHMGNDGSIGTVAVSMPDEDPDMHDPNTLFLRVGDTKVAVGGDC